MATLARAMHAVKSNVTQFLPEHVIRDAAEAVGHHYRQRKLGPVETVLTLVLQLLYANASLAHARAVAGGFAFTPSALCQARGRLPLALLARVLRWLIEQAAVGTGAGPRVLLVDAFNCYTPDAPALRRHYRRPRQQRSRRGADYPQVRTLGVFDLRTGLLLAQHHFAADRHESPQLRHVLAAARPGDVLVFDRGFVSYANLFLLRQAGVHVVARLAKGLSARRRDTRRTCVTRLGRADVLVRWDKPQQRPPGCPLGRRTWARLPQDLRLRQLTTSVKTGRRCRGSRCRRVTLITDLLDPTTHPAATVAQWYRQRWEVETDVRHLKQTMNLEFLHCRTPGNVERELLLRAIAYNLVRLAMLRAAMLRGIDADPGRVSFADACRWLMQSPDARISPAALLLNLTRARTARLRKVKYHGKNYRMLTARPAPQRRVA